MTAQELTPKEKQEVVEKEQTRPGRYYLPDVDIFEDEHSLRLSADMPGVEIANVNVELHDDVLTIEGRLALTAYEGLHPLYTEYNVGHFLRRFTLADASRFDANRISAQMQNGVLEIQLPKVEKARIRRIPITSS